MATEGKGDGKGKGERPPVTKEFIVSHMNADHADSLVAYARFYGQNPEVKKCALVDATMEGFVISLETPEGPKEIHIPYDTDEKLPLESLDSIGKIMVGMSKKARDNVFVTCNPAVPAEERVFFEAFNALNKDFTEKVKAGDFAGLAEHYAEDAVLVPLPKVVDKFAADILVGKDQIRAFMADSSTATLLGGLTMKSMKVHQVSATEVHEVGRAWGSEGRVYSRHWVKREVPAPFQWALASDNLPVN